MRKHRSQIPHPTKRARALSTADLQRVTGGDGEISVHTDDPHGHFGGLPELAPMP